MRNHDDECRSRDYPIQEDMPLQSRMWTAERVGWYGLCLLILASLAGLFGSGPLSTTSSTSENGTLSVQYEMFERNGASSEMVISAKADKDNKVWLVVDGDLLQFFTLEGIQPEPIATESFHTGMRFELKPDSNGWATAYLATRPSFLGNSRTEVRSGDQLVEVRQFIYP
jgi:hypothetical protein